MLFCCDDVVGRQRRMISSIDADLYVLPAGGIPVDRRRRDDRPDGPLIRSGVAGSRLNVAPDTTLPVDIGSVLWATLVPHSRARKTIATATFWRQWTFRISA